MASNTETERQRGRNRRLRSNDNLLLAYTHGPGTDEPVAMNTDTGIYFYIPDIQGSIRAIVDINGSLMASYVYDVWGTLISYNGTLAEKNDYMYTGREYDWEIGIYYYRYRYYNPEIGRFIQSSWEHNEEMNMYLYVNNDPVKGTDPTGHPYRPPTLPDHGSGSGSYMGWLCANSVCFFQIIVLLCGIGNFWLCTQPSSYPSARKIEACNLCFSKSNVNRAWRSCCTGSANVPPIGVSPPETGGQPAVIPRYKVRMIA